MVLYLEIIFSREFFSRNVITSAIISLKGFKDSSEKISIRVSNVQENFLRL